MRNKLRSILGIAPVEPSDDGILLHDKSILFNIGVLYLVIEVLIFYYSSYSLKSHTHEIAFAVMIAGLLVALKLSKRFFWFEMLVMTILFSELDDIFHANLAFKTSLFTILVVMVMVYCIVDFVRLLIPLMIFDSCLLGVMVLFKINSEEYVISILLILLLTVVVTFLGRDRYNAFRLNQRLTEQHNKLLHELKTANYNLNSELLKQSVHLMAVEETEEKFKTLTHSIDALIWIIDDSDRIVYSNHCPNHRYDIKETQFQKVRDLRQMIGDENYERVDLSIQAVRKTKEPLNIKTFPVCFNDGQAAWFNVKLASMNNGDILMTGYDVTDRKLNEDRIERLSSIKDMLLKLNPVLLREMDANDLFEFILDNLMSYVTYADLACILKLENGVLKVMAARGYNLEKLNTYSLSYEKSYVHHVTHGHFDKAVIINDIQRDYSVGYADVLESSEDKAVESSLCSPIIIEGRLYGMINIDSFTNHLFTDSDTEMMTYLATQLGYAVKNQSLLKMVGEVPTAY